MNGIAENVRYGHTCKHTETCYAYTSKYTYCLSICIQYTHVRVRNQCVYIYICIFYSFKYVFHRTNKQACMHEKSKLTNRQASRQTDRQTDKQTNIHTYEYAEAPNPKAPKNSKPKVDIPVHCALQATAGLRAVPEAKADAVLRTAAQQELRDN